MGYTGTVQRPHRAFRALTAATALHARMPVNLLNWPEPGALAAGQYSRQGSARAQRGVSRPPEFTALRPDYQAQMFDTKTSFTGLNPSRK